MKELIKLESRGLNENTLKLMKKPNNEESKTYLLETNSPIMRVGVDNNGNRFIDPSGGPMIIVNTILKEANMKVKSIDFILHKGYLITFE